MELALVSSLTGLDSVVSVTTNSKKVFSSLVKSDREKLETNNTENLPTGAVGYIYLIVGTEI